MRIIGGIHRSRRFPLPKNLKARPTTDFAKENLFNIIENLLDLEQCVALDLFSGTGSLSFELISRGCKQVTCVEKRFQHHQFIVKVQEQLQCTNLRALNGDVFKYLQHSTESFNFIFADPPYDLPKLSSIPEIILSKNMLNEGGLFVMEHPKEYDFSALPLFKQRRVYGAVNFSLFEKE